MFCLLIVILINWVNLACGYYTPYSDHDTAYIANLGSSYRIYSEGVCDNPDEVGFYLFPNPSNISDVDKLEYLNTSSIENSRFNKTRKVILLSHGFTESYKDFFPSLTIQAYLNAGNRDNIIAVDWGMLSGAYGGYFDVALLDDITTLPLYGDAVENVPIVGKRLANFTMFLQENGYVASPEDVHLVGHSLGAHISGMAGYFYNQETNASYARVTGIDPAGPSFQSRPPDQRLDETDADFVDIVHTNQEIFGYTGVLGDVDFFLNGGGPYPQPGCEYVLVTDPACSHNMAPLFYSASITNSTITAFRPGKLGNSNLNFSVIFGEFCPKTARGIYDLQLVLPTKSLPQILIDEIEQATKKATGYFDWVWNLFG